jgi:thymidylate kinase
MPLIGFFGPDGSGKSTLAKALAGRFEAHGLNVKVSWMRGTHTLASVLAKFLSRFASFRGSDNPYYGVSIPSRVKRLWQLIEFASVLPVLIFRFMLPSLLGYTIFAERYAPDFLVWVSLTTGDTDYLGSLEARFMLALSGKADAKIYVTASHTELMRRRSRETNSEFLSKQLELYDKIAKIVNANKIDTTERSVEETLKCLLSSCLEIPRIHRLLTKHGE